jgi:hypothetical protein
VLTLSGTRDIYTVGLVARRLKAKKVVLVASALGAALLCTREQTRSQLFLSLLQMDSDVC